MSPNGERIYFVGDEVNSDFHDSVPHITPDGKHLLFTQTTEEDDKYIYWMSAEVIHKLRSDDL